jgi:hypothetical protein
MFHDRKIMFAQTEMQKTLSDRAESPKREVITLYKPIIDSIWLGQ